MADKELEGRIEDLEFKLASLKNEIAALEKWVRTLDSRTIGLIRLR